MNDAGADDRIERLRRRREPPPLVPVEVVDRREVNERLLRLRLRGPGLDGMLRQPAASIRLLVPSRGEVDLVMPTWNGNEFLLPGGERPALRTFTPLSAATADHLDLEIVRHPGGVVSSWAEQAAPGAAAALSGPGRGFELPDDATNILLFGDETALPAITQLVARLPESVGVRVHLEVERDDAIRPLPDRAGISVDWSVRGEGTAPGAALVAAVSELAAVATDVHIWAAGEAASMQAIRTHLFDDRSVPRSQATIRGYWKPDRRTTSPS